VEISSKTVVRARIQLTVIMPVSKYLHIFRVDSCQRIGNKSVPQPLYVVGPKKYALTAVSENLTETCQ